MIELNNIYKYYENIAVLDNVNLFIQEGEIFGIIGKSGAGKSTLLRTINLLEIPTQGNLIINNQFINYKNNLNIIRHKIGMVFQNFNLLQSKTVSENIALPMHIQNLKDNDVNDKIDMLLELVELSDKKHSYPATLSGGQKQRVAIARALSCSTKILLCDEATSALDPETTQSILALLKKINQIYNITTIIVTHEMDVIKSICHRLAVMEQGKIIETTAITEIFDTPNSIARHMLYNQISPQLPPCLTHRLSNVNNHRPLLRLLFQGTTATIPFISQTSRKLNVDINILLANIDKFNGVTCGVLIIELHANNDLLQEFIICCKLTKLIVEILGYVNDNEL